MNEWWWLPMTTGVTAFVGSFIGTLWWSHREERRSPCADRPDHSEKWKP